MAHGLLVLAIAAGLGAALGIIRPVRREIVPRSAHVIQAQILLAIVGAMIIVIVAESLARAFAIVGAAGLVRYRARIDDPKDAGVMLVALAVGLATGGGLYLFASLSCVFVIAVLWVLESLEPAVRSRFELTIDARDPDRLRGDVEQVLQRKGIVFELKAASSHQLQYEVTVPLERKMRKLTKSLRRVGGHGGTHVTWSTKHQPRVAA
jgi:uncharacterized membrane protein YhiD involved in acid resistance